jgi:hypothetical protein
MATLHMTGDFECVLDDVQGATLMEIAQEVIEIVRGMPQEHLLFARGEGIPERKLWAFAVDSGDVAYKLFETMAQLTPVIGLKVELIGYCGGAYSTSMEIGVDPADVAGTLADRHMIGDPTVHEVITCSMMNRKGEWVINTSGGPGDAYTHEGTNPEELQGNFPELFKKILERTEA